MYKVFLKEVIFQIVLERSKQQLLVEVRQERGKEGCYWGGIYLSAYHIVENGGVKVYSDQIESHAKEFELHFMSNEKLLKNIWRGSKKLHKVVIIQTNNIAAWRIEHWEVPFLKGKEENDGGKAVIKWFLVKTISIVSLEPKGRVGIERHLESEINKL